jgi:hypothetical protein
MSDIDIDELKQTLSAVSDQINRLASQKQGLPVRVFNCEMGILYSQKRSVLAKLAVALKPFLTRDDLRYKIPVQMYAPR